MGECFITRRGGGGAGANKLPEFSYTGTYQTIDDGDGNWRVKFLTSGVLTLSRNVNTDVFLVGAGGKGSDRGSGGAGGFTATYRNQTLAKGTGHTIVVGAGSTGGGTGGTSSLGVMQAAGGNDGIYEGSGAAGGSGSGAYGYSNTSLDHTVYCIGGSDGGNGGNGTHSRVGGTGQGSTTREFGEPTGEMYAGGGAGGTRSCGYRKAAGGEGGGGTGGHNRSEDNSGGDAGQPNTGGGGGGAGGSSGRTGGNGGSGIVIIRNAR